MKKICRVFFFNHKRVGFIFYKVHIYCTLGITGVNPAVDVIDYVLRFLSPGKIIDTRQKLAEALEGCQL